MSTQYIINNSDGLLTGQTITGNITVNGDLSVTGTTNILPYKVYTALLTQSGGDDPQILFNGDSLTIGVTYVITDDGTGYVLGDFTNVGAPNNELGTSFVATGDIPNDWGTDITLHYNTGAPVVTVLENTIGDVYWTRTGIGMYDSISNGNFTINKTFILVSVENGLTWQVSPSPYGDGNKIYFEAGTSDVYTDGVISQVEIRVYN